MVFPFVGAEGQNGYCRIKPDNPRVIKNGKTIKYESPKGRPNEIYLPPSVAQLLDGPNADLLLTEGEKKSLKATQDGFPCIGLVGVYGWKDGKSEQLLPSLERIAWKGRRAFIVFDSDAADNPQVRDAESRLAKQLADREATVRVVRLPGAVGADGKPQKVGLDDFLVANGPTELRKLLDSAGQPEPVDPAAMKAEASDIDAADEAEEYLDSVATDEVPRLRFWRGSFVVWREHCYRDVKQSEVRGRLIQFLNRRYKGLTRHKVSDVLDQLQAQAMLRGDVEPPAWIADPPLNWPADEVLSTKNALVHLPSLVSRRDCSVGPTPRFFSTVAVDYDFAIDAPRPDEWLLFLGQLWPVDSESIATLQEWFGYCLTADTRLQKMLLLIGPKRSGKGTIARIQRAMIGSANAAGPTLASFCSNLVSGR